MNVTTNSDGGARGNPCPAAIGIIIRDDSGKILETYGGRIGNATSNTAEYEAIIQALTLAAPYKPEEVTCILDSELVVKQLQGKYAVRKPDLRPLYLTTKELEKNFKKVTYKNVPREDKFQKLADKIVNKTLDGKKFEIPKG